MNARSCLWLLALVLAGSRSVAAQDGAASIRLNQLGFYPNAPKHAVVVSPDAGPFHVIDLATDDTVYHGTLGPAHVWPLSGETVRQADCSRLRAPGTYALVVPSLGTSYPFAVQAAVHRPLAAGALKGYYYQRASTPLDARYAGPWARAAGHPDDAVAVHPSAATAQRPAGTLIAAPRGWYDAGDYNKYIVNSGISTYTLLALCEQYPAFSAHLEAGIPESDNAVPDVLDEAVWNLRWMLTMQDPHDGGVYHKLTHATFQGIVMPHEATAPRYVVQKSTAAALNFAAVMAQATRLLANQASAFPGLADSTRAAALNAWRWARRNPEAVYNQRALNESYDPDVVTGAYGGRRVDDEFAWAAAELFITTAADSFLTAASPLDHDPSVPSWSNVEALGWYTLLHYRRQAAAVVDTAAMKQRFLRFADQLAGARTQLPYGTVMGHEAGDFVWGSNAVAANQAMTLLQAFRLTADSTYLWAALSNQDYLLGRNAVGYSFVTGFGALSPGHPHHRPSEADTVAAPVPGLLVGGPNPGRQDGCIYASTLPARAYLDAWCSYASNEIAINWNAPLVYVTTALEAALSDKRR